jgi:SAM-dependent methyltransferase
VDFANIEQAEHWSQAAPAWLELEDQLEEVSRLPGELAMERLALGPGQRVVDLGCGSGMTTLELASRVGPGGGAVGVDISAEMLARAPERAALADSGNIAFVHADVQVHEWGEARFDAAYSRFGVMFFADPVAAFTNVRRALRPGACCPSSAGRVCSTMSGCSSRVRRWRRSLDRYHRCPVQASPARSPSPIPAGSAPCSRQPGSVPSRSGRTRTTS